MMACACAVGSSLAGVTMFREWSQPSHTRRKKCAGIGSLLVVERQRERKRRALSLLALHGDPSAVQLNEFPAQRQPQPRALHLLVRRPHLAKLLKDRSLILRCDAHTGVG